MHRPVLGSLLLVLAAGCASTPQTAAKLDPLEVREGKWEIRGTRLHVRDVGPESAPALVVVHGGPGGNHQSLLPLETLAPRHRVVFYDQRGTGESDRFEIALDRPETLAQLTLEENIADLEALRVTLGKERISLVGHSWGGSLAVFYAAAYPERVERLIVYSGGPEDRALQVRKSQAHFARLTDEEKGLVKDRSGLLEQAVENSASQEELDRLFLDVAKVLFPALYCERPAEGAEEGGRAGFWANQVVGSYSESFDRAQLAPKLAAIEAPVLLTWGRCEPSPRERLDWMLEHLPDARLVVFEKSGHNAMREEPALFMDLVRSFLEGSALPAAAKSYRARGELPAE